jgi:hypothetical protein
VAEGVSQASTDRTADPHSLRECEPPDTERRKKVGSIIRRTVVHNQHVYPGRSPSDFIHDAPEVARFVIGRD